METARNIQHPASSIQHRHRGFTLVELLVVITIIGILASLIVVAAVGALKTAQQSRIKVELNQISDGIEELKNKHTAYPPNCQTDDTDFVSAAEPATMPLSESQVLSDLKRYLQMVSPKHRESDDLLKCLAGLNPSNSSFRTLPGGMSAGEAVVFWLGGFSNDPKYPISGEGGPSYLKSLGNADPIESRKWVFPFAVERLGPRNDQEYFDDTSAAGERYIFFADPRFPTDRSKDRRINFWQYTPAKSTQPYLYFDTSRHPPTPAFDPPASSGAHVHALKKRSDTQSAGILIQFVDPNKFQLLHCGIDDAWGEEEFERMSIHGLTERGDDITIIDNYLLFPTGPFTGDIADTVVNFATQTKLEDATP